MTEQTITSGIDHPIIAVRDMTAARAAYERLGFTVTPRGSHPEWGTGNWCMMFPSDYLELRGIIEPKETHNLAEFLREREGLMGLALDTNDAEASHNNLLANGVSPEPVRQLTRNFELPEGAVRPRFSLCFLNPADTPGLMWVVLCQHMTPELLRKPAWLDHANGALGVRKMTGVVRDIAAAAAAHRKIFGDDAVRTVDDRITIRLKNQQSIELLTPEAAEAALAGTNAPLLEGQDYLCSLTLQIHDVKATVPYLASRDVSHRVIQNSVIRVDPAETCGVLLEFVE